MNNKITNFEIISINYSLVRMFVIGITFNGLLTVIKQDSWIIPLISIIPAFILILFINYIMNYKPKLNISDKILELFGKKIGIIINVFIASFTLIMGLINYLNLNNFIHSQFLNKTPIIVISIIFSLALIYILSKGINTLTKTSLILFYIGVILFITSLIGLIANFEISNLKPFFQAEIKDYFKCIGTIYSYNITPIFLLTIIPKGQIKNPKIIRILTFSFLLSMLTIFFVFTATIGTFGYELNLLYNFPEFHVLKHISIIGLTARIENILVIQWIFDMFISIAFIIYFICECLKKIIKIKKQKINLLYLIICGLLITGTNLLSKYNIYINKITTKYLEPPIIICSLIIVIIISIKIKLKTNLLNKE